MKRIILTFAALVAVTVPLLGAQYRAQSFIADGLQSVIVSNAVVGLTNLLSTAVTTNTTGVAWTNGLGTRVVVVDDGTAPDFKNVFKDVTLWPMTPYQYDAAAGVIQTNHLATDASIFIRIIGGSSSDAAVVFVFVPTVEIDGVVIESTVAADAISVSITAASGYVCSTTKLDPIQWPGFRGVRLKKVYSADTGANATVTIKDCVLQGFIP